MAERMIDRIRARLRERAEWASANNVIEDREAEFCCGVLELGEFQSGCDELIDWLDKDMEEAFDEYAHSTKINLLAYALKHALYKVLKNKAAFYFATTVHPSKKAKYRHNGQRRHQAAAEIALKKCGFKPIGVRKNPASSNNITMWVKKGK